MLHLASRSPRRAELLTRLGLRFGVLELELPEVRQPGEAALDYVCRVAREKAGAGLLRVVAVPASVVLGADTEVVFDGDVFGKPADAGEAAAMLRRLSGRRHEVITAVVVLDAGREAMRVSVTGVEFGDLDEAWIARYLATGEWRGVAGAYAIQGRAGACIRRIEGSCSGVMGLPLFETGELLRAFGVEV
jgi:septum formation protein